jgi:hypothetical protein
MLISEYLAAGFLPGQIYMSARKPWPAVAHAARTKPAPRSVRDYFGRSPNLHGAECYVYRDGPYDWTLLLINGDGGAELLSRTSLKACLKGARWLASRGAAVVVWPGNFWDMPAASRGGQQ